jgi:hypothetical protein
MDGGTTWMELPLAPFGAYMKASASPADEAVYRYTAMDDEGAVTERYFASPVQRREGDRVFCECIPEVSSDGLVFRIVTDRILASTPSVRLMGGAGGDSATVYQTEARSYAAFVSSTHIVDGLNAVIVAGTDYRGYPLASVTAFRAFRLSSGSSFAFDVSDSLRATLHAQSIRDTALCLVSETMPPAVPPGGCRSSAPPFLIDFPEKRLMKPIKLDCDPGRRYALFRWSGSEWKCVGVPRMEGGCVKIGEQGIYAFFRDEIPPDVKHVAVENQHAGSGFFKPYTCFLPVKEEGSGVDPYSVYAYLDGSRVVCEWDDFRGRLEIPIPSTMTRGMARLKVEVSDRVGNRSVGEFGFVLQ